MAELPEAIGLCPNRVGDSGYVVAGVFLQVADLAEEPCCDHCGRALAVYLRQRDAGDSAIEGGA